MNVFAHNVVYSFDLHSCGSEYHHHWNWNVNLPGFHFHLFAGRNELQCIFGICLFTFIFFITFEPVMNYLTVAVFRSAAVEIKWVDIELTIICWHYKNIIFILCPSILRKKNNQRKHVCVWFYVSSGYLFFFFFCSCIFIENL